MIFIVVIMAACAIIASYETDTVEDGKDPSQLMTIVESTVLRLSDLTDGDDSMVRMTDLLAVYALQGTESIGEYSMELLNGWTGGREGSIRVVYTDRDGTMFERVLGSENPPIRSTERTFPVSTGGTIAITIAMCS